MYFFNRVKPIWFVVSMVVSLLLWTIFLWSLSISFLLLCRPN